MQNYLDLLKKILETGEPHKDRTGVGTISLFGGSLSFDLDDGKAFPIMTTKRVSFRAIFYELMWFLSGSNDIRDLQKHGVYIWDANYKSDYWRNSAHFKEYSVGKNYGWQWRNWNRSLVEDERRFTSHEIDQITSLLFSLTVDPNSRRHLVTAWNPSETHMTALPPCHVLFQVKVHADEALSMTVYMRSADVFLGVPFNITSYALLLMMLSRITGRKARRLMMFFGDVHIYNTHRSAVETQLARTPMILPSLHVLIKKSESPTVDDLLSLTFDDCTLEHYIAYPAIPAPMAV